MLATYIRTAFRNIFKRRLYSLISVSGLALGLSVAIMIGLFLRAETSFDTMHADYDRIYRYNWSNVGTGARFATFFNAVSPRFGATLPDQIETTARLGVSDHLVKIGDKKSYESIAFVDPDYFALFDYGPNGAQARAAMESVRSMVLTKAAAVQLFGDADVIGRTITLDGTNDFRIAAVVENSPSASHLIGNIFVPMKTLPALWGRSNFEQLGFSDVVYHYVKLAPGVLPEKIEAQALAFLVHNVSEQAKDFVGVHLQPLVDIHFTTELQNEMAVRDTVSGVVKSPRQASDINIFSAVAVLTLVIAAFNFMNLQVIQISTRVREVAVRKVLGANRREILKQFLVETCMLTFLGLFLALVVTEALLPFFGNLVGADLKSGMVIQPDILLMLLALCLVLACAAGAYPALVASRTLPTDALRGESLKGMGPAKLRAGLVLLQFSIAIGLISASGVVNSQISFTMEQPLGFDADNVALVNLPNRTAYGAYPSMKAQLENEAGIEAVSASFAVPTQDLSNGWSFQIAGGDPDFELRTRTIAQDARALGVLGMEFVAGRGFSEAFPADKTHFPSEEEPKVKGAVVLNETAARNAGFANPADAVGKYLYTAGNRGFDYQMDFEIVGVVRDAHYQSMRSEIAPISYMWQDNARSMIVKIRPGFEVEALAAIDRVWRESLSDFPIRRKMLDDEYQALFAGENRTFSLFIGFAGVAVLIACIGLYGLTAYMVERRVKEIGIRKVLGATIANIVGLLSWNFLRLVIVANLIAWPLVWWIMRDWLESFAYRTDIDFSVFLLAGLAALMLAGATTSMRTYSAARANPVYALRRE